MAEKTYYGGQAVLEGVMMRGRQDMAVSVRAPSGEIVVYHEAIVPRNTIQRLRPLPFLRGVFMLWDTMLLGMRALVFSANVGMNEDEVAAAGTQDGAEDGMAGVALWGTVAVSLLFSIALFFVSPLVLVSFVDRYISSSLLSNLIEGGIRLVILIGYMLILGQVADIRRVFGYHGAEHKTINAFEAGDPLDVEHVRRHSISHPRCGTGFLLIVVLFSILVFAMLGRPDLLPRIASRILLVPVIAGIAYEFMKWTAAHYRNPLVRVAIAPSLALQHLTTRDPDDSMLEVAIVSFERVRLAEGAVSMAAFDRPDIVLADQSGRALRPIEAPAGREPVIQAD